MILVLGGTTEGRKAVAELEEAGNIFYYSTKTGEQEVELCHGIAIQGAMTEEAMLAFCQQKQIRLLVDAAHPFATILHYTVARVANQLRLPVIRFERIFPPRDTDITWVDSYDDVVQLLSKQPGTTVEATTGVQSIARLKVLENHGIKMYYHILDRPSSLIKALACGVGMDQLIRYGQENQLHADVMILKESGLSGGFQQKVDEARRRNMKMIAIRRPAMPQSFNCVNGEHGLRLMVEKLLPEFFPLHSGLTTGTCATAAAVAAYRQLMGKQQTDTVDVMLPNGETIPVAVGYGMGYAYVIKPSGDDPDITKGAEIRAAVTCTGQPLSIKGGEGIGRFTLPGFDYPPGEAAINKVPREMIHRNLHEASVCVTLSVVGGEELAQHTFNPRLGIEGGISIVGVSGIIKPFSEQAFVDSIRKCMTVAKAAGFDTVVINSGAKSERMVRNRFPTLPAQCFVEYGNYIGDTLKIAQQLQFAQVCLVMMMGKAVKLAAGHLDTHSKRCTMDKDFIAKMLAEAGCDENVCRRALQMTLARELWTIVPADRQQAFIDVLTGYCYRVCHPLLPNGQLEIIILNEE